MRSASQATPLSSVVKLGLTRDLPIAIEYTLPEGGWLKFFLAPKIDDEEEMAAEEAESKPALDD